MDLTLEKSAPSDATAIGVPVTTDELTEALDTYGVSPGFATGQGFEGKVGQSLVVPGDDGAATVLLGVGAAAKVDTSVLRRAAAFLARVAGRHEVVATTLASAGREGVTAAEAASAVAEGAAAGNYRFRKYRTRVDGGAIERFVLVGGGGQAVRNALTRSAAVIQAVDATRDLVNEPGGELTPPRFADAAVAVAERVGLQVTVHDEKSAKKEAMAGLLAVNRGSSLPPRFVELAYEPERARGAVALVGKGITFDSGGLSLKTGEGMLSMNSDMAGAAAVLGAMSLVPELAPRMRVVAYLPMTDNMTGGDAQRLGDVIRYRNGTTVEVLNTDAEGRLILADALIRASEARPDAIVDLATLTGACKVALGNRVAGVMGNHKGLSDQVLAAAARAGEPMWPLPLPDAYRRSLDSRIADLKNIGGKWGGALTAGLFLREFVADGIPWAHLDIAGPAWGDDEDGEYGAGGTGFAVSSLIRFLSDFKKPGRE